jgi:hypothetical protein
VGLGVRLRIAAEPAFLGADSVGYLKLAHELRTDGRYALSPDDPLAWYRRPLYPMFLAALHENERAAQVAQSVIDVLAGLLVFFCARKLAGPLAGFVALGLAMLCPITIPYTSAMLTETLANALTLAAIAPLIVGERFAWGAAAAGLAALLRPDGIVLILVYPLALSGAPKARSRRAGLVCLAAFLAVFAWWPVRNLIHFGTPHLTDGMVDRQSREVPHWRGYWTWLANFAVDDRPFTAPAACYYDWPRCMPTLDAYDRLAAFANPDERTQVEQLFEQRRTSGLTQELDDRFDALARHHRARAILLLPFARLANLWVGAQDELFHGTSWHPWITRAPPTPIHWLILALALVGAITLVRRPPTRTVTVAILTLLVIRSEWLAWSGFCLPRYLQPVYGLLLMLAGAGIVGLLPARFRPTIDPWTRDASSNS